MQENTLCDDSASANYIDPTDLSFRKGNNGFEIGMMAFHTLQ